MPPAPAFDRPGPPYNLAMSRTGELADRFRAAYHEQLDLLTESVPAEANVQDFVDRVMLGHVHWHRDRIRRHIR